MNSSMYSGLYDNFSKMVCHKKTIGFVMQSLNGSRLSIVRTDEGGSCLFLAELPSISQTGPVCPKPILRLKPRPSKFLLQHHRTSHGGTADAHRYVPIKNSELLQRQTIYPNARIFKIN